MRGIVVLVVIASVGAMTTGTAGAAERVTLSGPEVVDYGLAGYEFEDSTRHIVEGTPDSGGCRFTGEGTLQPGESVTQVEIAYDPATCRSLVERGTLVGDGPPEGSVRDGAQARSEAGGAPTDGLSAQSVLGRFRAYQWSWYDEPARWVQGCDVEDSCGPLPPVNTVKNSVEWVPDGSCAVAPGYTGWNEYEITWLTLTGWEVKRNDWNHAPDPIPCEQDIYSENYNHFQNRAFCTAVGGVLGAIFETNTYYEPNHVHGDRNGVAYYRWSARKSGLCSALLRFNQKQQNVRIG